MLFQSILLFRFKTRGVDERTNCFEKLLQTVVKRIGVLEEQVSSIVCSKPTTHLPSPPAETFVSARSSVRSNSRPGNSIQLVLSRPLQSPDSKKAPILSLAQLCSQLHELEIENGPTGGCDLKPPVKQNLQDDLQKCGKESSEPVKDEAEIMDSGCKHECRYWKCLCCQNRSSNVTGTASSSSFFLRHQLNPLLYGCSAEEKHRLLEDYKGELSLSPPPSQHFRLQLARFVNLFKELQRLFNKRVKYEVNRKFGPNYLAEHQVRELDFKEMLSIKSESNFVRPFVRPAEPVTLHSSVSFKSEP